MTTKSVMGKVPEIGEPEYMYIVCIFLTRIFAYCFLFNFEQTRIEREHLQGTHF
jgi:hypothetical protein